MKSNYAPLVVTPFLAAALSLSPAPKTSAAEGLFPLPQAGITVGAEGSMTYAELVERFCDSTGIDLLLGPGVLAQLEQTSVEALRPLEVPPGEVYSVVETMLVSHGFFLEPVDDGPILRLVNAAQLQFGLFVHEDELDGLRGHPALTVWTVVSSRSIDARQLGNSLRIMMTDGVTAAFAAGNTNAMILRGCAGDVADLRRLIHTASASQDRQLAPDPDTRAEASMPAETDTEASGDK